MISGPSFLGLNDPPPRKRSSLGLDADRGDAGSAGHLDYLLEDEEEPHRSGAWKFALIAVALALAVGLGYLRWKNQGFGWLGAGANKPVAATQPADSADSNPPAPTSDSAGSPGASPNSSTTSPPPSSPAQAVPAQTGATQPAPDSTESASGAAANSAASPSGNAAPSAEAGSAANQPAATTPPATADKGSATALAKPAAAARTRLKPPAAVVAAKPSPAQVGDPVSEAQKYIYGKGVAQDCEHGLHLLKPAADHANPKAMIEMGALYSAGLCTPRDLPTAYRWFALALRKQPDNISVQTDLQKLWGEMTQPERQLAIRLSQ